MAAAVLWAVPAAAMDALAWGDLFADAFRSSFRDAREISAAVDPADPGLDRGEADRVYLFLSDVTVNGMAYDRLTVNLQGVKFLLSGGSALIQEIASGSIDGSVSAEKLETAILSNYPRLTGSSLSLEGDQIYIRGVYKRDALIPLRASLQFWGQYRIVDGEGHLELSRNANDNAMVSGDDVGAAICSAAPAISFKGSVVSPPVISVTLSQNTLWVKATADPQAKAAALEAAADKSPLEAL